LASVNVVSAQEYEINPNGSIYGLEAFFIDDYVVNFSFYSTYDLNELLSHRNDFAVMWVDFYNDNSKVFSYVYDYVRGTTTFDAPPVMGEASIEHIDSDVYKITVRNCMVRNCKESYEVNRLVLYFAWNLYSPSNSGGMEIQASSWWQSNVLTAFISETSSLTETFTDNDIITYKYFLLSGVESEIMPVGVPFIQVVYKNGVVIERKKYFLK